MYMNIYFSTVYRKKKMKNIWLKSTREELHEVQSIFPMEYYAVIMKNKCQLIYTNNEE